MISLKPRYIKRYAQIGRLLIKYGREELVDQWGLRPAISADAETIDASEKPEEFARDLESMGPVFIKLGQLLSSRSDLFPPAYLDALARLQDHVESVPLEEIREVITQELGLRIARDFAEFDLQPVASGSLAQVHRAQLHSGKIAAVKVQRPNIREQVIDDLAAVMELAEALDEHSEFGRTYGFLSIAQSLHEVMMHELDFLIEARNARTLGENLQSFERFVVPQPINDYCTRRVLTMDYVSGTKITELSQAVLVELDRRELADELFRAYLHQVLVDGLFHADPHPGNMFLTRDHRIALIDCGMMVRVAPELQRKLIKLLLAISDGRGEDAARAAEELSSRRNRYDSDEFTRRVSSLVMNYQQASGRDLQAGRVLVEIQSVAGATGYILPHEATMLGKTLMNLDRVIFALDPDFDVNDAFRDRAAEIVQRHTTHGMSLSRVFQTLLDASELIQALPDRINRISNLIAQNKLKVEVDAIDERKLIEGLHKIGNRITLGLLLASLIIGASLMMQLETDWDILGYPPLAMFFFLIAAIASLILAYKIAFGDKKDI